MATRWSMEEENILKNSLENGIRVSKLMFKLKRTKEAIVKRAYKFYGYCSTTKKGITFLYLDQEKKVANDKKAIGSLELSFTTADDMGNQSDVIIPKSETEIVSDKNVNKRAIELLEANKIQVSIENIYRFSLAMKEGA